MTPLRFDHLALGAFDIEQGVQWFHEATGLAIPAGGKHPLMATQNHLTATGNDGFLEVIAIDHEADAPLRRRWFGLDEEATRERISKALVPLVWVLGTSDIDASLEIVKEHGFDIGPAIEMTRGDLNWRLTVREDGLLPDGGTVPALIQWRAGPHPSRNMQNIGIKFDYVRLHNDTPDQLQALLYDLGCDDFIEVVKAEGREEGIEVGLLLPDGRAISFG
jgi:hypothetical protein